jgi:hypothetical protein
MLNSAMKANLLFWRLLSAYAWARSLHVTRVGPHCWPWSLYMFFPPLVFAIFERPAARILHRVVLGLVPGTDLVDCVACLDLDARRKIFRRVVTRYVSISCSQLILAGAAVGERYAAR